MPALPDLAQPLSDGRIALRMAAEWDIPDILIAYQDDPELHLRLGEDRPPSGAQLGSAAERLEAERLAGTGLALTIVEPGSDDCRGRVNVHKVDWDNRRAELGIWVAPRLRRRGVARAALRLAGGWLFDASELRRLAILTDVGNEPMLRAARAAGFHDEGVLRAYARQRGGRSDVAILSLVPDDLSDPG
jgi:RimJ/RimL family protein N-acetyltransferase